MIAVVFGGTGMTGEALLKQLASNPSYSAVYSIQRRSTKSIDGVEVVVVDFDSNNLSELIPACDVAFCCLGTTAKKAKNQEAYTKLDHDLVMNLASIVLQKGCSSFVYQSSMGANEKSSIFYSRLKGRTERELTNLGFEKLTIVRPSLLLGDRKEFRLGEKISMVLMKLFDFMMVGSLKLYRAIPVEQVAKAMILLNSRPENGVLIATNDRLWMM